MAEPPPHPPPTPGTATPPPAESAVSPALRAALFDPESWRESLEAYTHSTHLAVALVDEAGYLRGPCLNPRPTWSRLHPHLGTGGGGCPFALMPATPCTCVRDALARRAPALARDRTGLVHVAVPLVLDEQLVGALLAGQVFDQYTEPLVLEHVATHAGLSPQAVWQVARLEVPVKPATVRVYGHLLAALGQAFLHARYHTLMDAQRLAVLDQRFQARTAALHREIAERQARTAVLYHEIAERQAAEARVHQAHAQLQALMARQDALREAERTQLARDLHDDLGQQLTALRMDVVWIGQRLGTMTRSRTVPALLERVRDATALVDTLLGRVHDLAVDLRPSVLDRLGLGPALTEEARRFQARAAIATTVRLPDPELALAPDVATTLFRIFQECLTNVARHAGATQVEAALTAEDGWVTLRVQDNGRGITDAERRHPAGFGLLGMHERAVLVGGEVCVTHGAGHGTLVTVRLPQRGRPGSGFSPMTNTP